MSLDPSELLLFTIFSSHTDTPPSIFNLTPWLTQYYQWRYHPKLTKQRSFSIFCSIGLLISLAFIFVFLDYLQYLQSPFHNFQQQRDALNRTLHFNSTNEVQTMASRLRDSVVFLPLKDLRFADTAMDGHTWFMSYLNDTQDKEGEIEYLYFPSKASKGRLLCLSGHDTTDGGKNLYALAWPDSLPERATLMKGFTFVSDNYYDYNNLWHGLTAMVSWVLFHKGELRTKMGSWLENVMEATFGKVKVEGFEDAAAGGPSCFEKAVVMRHSWRKMEREKMVEVYDVLRCKARTFCNMSLPLPVRRRAEGVNKGPIIGLTMLLRRGSRSFRNESAVVGIFKRECLKLGGCCRLKVAHSDDLSFCDQVRLMGTTDILVSPHGAQLSNMFLMERNSSVMEFFPKGWLKLAGVGQYVFHWMASWSGMRHEGAWWDPNDYGDECPYHDDDHHRCFGIYKDGKIGHNETFFALWARDVLNKVKLNKMNETRATASPPSMKESTDQLMLPNCTSTKTG
uniref:Glycosyltransferase 61 catalytic domain-containing protein n=1 Tax=Nelumbo nucifera TaxID=4432 RepID=A0A822ZD88_NELNU|nr:TPA_asm: hypothetical protein HUJ06_015319 [Nelumbo nucifera]